MKFELYETAVGTGILDDVIEELAERLEGWGFYEVENVENIYPLKRWQLVLRSGTVEQPGDVVYSVTVDVNEQEKTAAVEVE